MFANYMLCEIKVLLISMKPIIYTEVVTLKISKQQKQTLNKLKSKNYKVAQFIRDAISEKLQREKHEILKPKKQYCPFSNGTIEI